MSASTGALPPKRGRSRNIVATKQLRMRVDVFDIVWMDKIASIGYSDKTPSEFAAYSLPRKLAMKDIETLGKANKSAHAMLTL